MQGWCGSTRRGDEMNLALFIPVGLAVIGVAIYARSGSVFNARVSFLFSTKEDSRIYASLPSFNEMMLNPRHWGRWTSAQWRAWAISKGVK